MSAAWGNRDYQAKRDTSSSSPKRKRRSLKKSTEIYGANPKLEALMTTIDNPASRRQISTEAQTKPQSSHSRREELSSSEKQRRHAKRKEIEDEPHYYPQYETDSERLAMHKQFERIGKK